jgi:hypothetical protein
MQEVSGSIPLGSTISPKMARESGLFCWAFLMQLGDVDVGVGGTPGRPL